MFFVLQKEDCWKSLEIEPFLVKEIIENNRISDDYTFASIHDFDEGIVHPKFMKTAIPVGTIDFVEAWLKNQHGIDHIHPIEVPEILRKEKFLKRNYRIVPYSEIPKERCCFLKDVSRLKQFSGEVFTEEINQIPLDPVHWYQVSEIVRILSEYRVYVQDDQIQAVAHYNGDPCLFPDANLLKDAVCLYSTQKDRPGSYTMDVAVSERGTFLLEIHPWISIGLYNSLWNRKLLYAYKDGIDWVLNHNKGISDERKE